ncbi:MAG: fructose-1,6-bisphosphatase [Lachnospiraceae bacterium]|nr:fructose-1,6-bisphosphatase [Lachnospiraceae bacterium]
MEEKYLRVLGKLYPNRQSVATEMINLSAIMNLPKGTEHYVTDLHGEYEQFTHILRNGSGAVKRKIEDTFGHTITEQEKRSLATLIYYPEKKMQKVLADKENPEEWYGITLRRLVKVAKRASFKYSRSKLRKALPKDFSYVMEELLSNRSEISDLEGYYDAIFDQVIHTGRAQELIVAFSDLIRRLTVDHLHVIGDIFDRGPYPDKIMDDLMNLHSIDIQWGNHDVLWMGAACGHMVSVATVLRICARYGNLDILEDGYGINVLPLVRFTLDHYLDDPCECFDIHYRPEDYKEEEQNLDMKIHKAISIIQFKLEGQLIKDHPEFHMDDRLLLETIDLEKGTVMVEGKEYPLLDKKFPTLDPKNPYQLTPEEEDVMKRMQQAFLGSEKLQRHIRFLYDKGRLYKIANNQLLFHGCLPLNEDGSFKEVEVDGKVYKGKALYDILEKELRNAYYKREPHVPTKSNVHWWCWTAAGSPLFGKSKMATFERYFLADKAIHKEHGNSYYKYLENEKVVNSILEDFGLCGDGDECHIINGHMPVKVTKGESPVKCGGKVLTIDGGFSKAYQGTTGIAGYTLTYNSYGMVLVSHEPFTSIEDAVEKETDVFSHQVLAVHATKRRLVKDTDTGRELAQNMKDLEKLLEAYRYGKLPEA